MTTRAPAGSMRVRGSLAVLPNLLTPVLISLFFVEALRLFYSQLYLVVWAALFSDPIDIPGLLIAILMLSSFVAPLLLFPLRRVLRADRIALISAIGVAAARTFMSAGLPFEAEAIASYVTIAFYGLFLPCWFAQHDAQNRSGAAGGYLVTGFILALAYDMSIRALGTTVDLSLRPEWLPVQLALSAAAIASAIGSSRSTTISSSKVPTNSLPAWGLVLILSGLGTVLFLEYNLFAHASTTSRSLMVDYDWLALLIPAATAVALLIPCAALLSSVPAVLAQNLVILASMASFLWFDGPLSAAVVLIAQVCVIMDLRLLFSFAASRSAEGSAATMVGLSMVLSLFLAFTLLLIYTFSFAYAYTLDVFRGTEPVPFLLAASILGATASVAAWKGRREVSTSIRVPWLRESFAAGSVILALIASAVQSPVSPEPLGEGPVTVMSYNLHQAFGMDNKLDLEEILATIREGDPDIIGFQEADAGRVPSLSIDEVLWLSRRLNMYSAYAPSWGSTYGVAVLSKYPIVEHRRYLLTSEEQQRACLKAAIDVRGETLGFFSVHIGLSAEERERQLDEVLKYTAATPPPQLLVGDFNANPGSREIGRVLEQFNNAFGLSGTGTGYTSPADLPGETIDYIFVSPDVEVLSATVISSLASDHLPVVAVVQIPAD